MEKTYVLTIFDCPKSVNAGGGGSRAHWGQAHREKTAWQGRFIMELLAAKVPRKMESCRVNATVRWKNRNRRDTSNYYQPIYKPLLDALVKGGYLPDDTDEYVRAEPVKFEYPEQWDRKLATVEMIVQLEAVYK